MAGIIMSIWSVVDAANGLAVVVVVERDAF
jgi:hypothetical protein